MRYHPPGDGKDFVKDTFPGRTWRVHFLAWFFEEGACKYLKFCLWYKTTDSFSYGGFTSLRTRWVWADTNQANPLGFALDGGVPELEAIQRAMLQINEIQAYGERMSRELYSNVCVRGEWEREDFFFPLILIFWGKYFIICQPLLLLPEQFFLSPKLYQVRWSGCSLMKSWNFWRKVTLLTNKNTISEKHNFLEKEKPHPISTENFQIELIGLGNVIISLSLRCP